MRKIIRTTVAAATFSVAGIGLAGVAAAQDTGYVPPACTEVVGGVETQVDCVSDATLVADPPQAQAVAAVQSAGALPYTGNNSSLPLAEAGVALVAGGGALILVVKRRQAHSNS